MEILSSMPGGKGQEDRSSANASAQTLADGRVRFSIKHAISDAKAASLKSDLDTHVLDLANRINATH